MFIVFIIIIIFMRAHNVALSVYTIMLSVCIALSILILSDGQPKDGN